MSFQCYSVDGGAVKRWGSGRSGDVPEHCKKLSILSLLRICNMFFFVENNPTTYTHRQPHPPPSLHIHMYKRCTNIHFCGHAIISHINNRNITTTTMKIVYTNNVHRKKKYSDHKTREWNGGGIAFGMGMVEYIGKRHSTTQPASQSQPVRQAGSQQQQQFMLIFRAYWFHWFFEKRIQNNIQDNGNKNNEARKKLNKI